MGHSRLRIAVVAALAILAGCTWSAAAENQPAADEGMRAARASRPLVVDLWPGQPPGDVGISGEERFFELQVGGKPYQVGGKPTRWLTNVSRPSITVYRPPQDKDTGVAMLICPGGGYHNLGWRAGREVHRDLRGGGERTPGERQAGWHGEKAGEEAITPETQQSQGGEVWIGGARMIEVSASVARAQWGRLFERVAQGDRVLITRRGKAVAMLVPPEGDRQADVAEVVREMLAFRTAMDRD